MNRENEQKKALQSLISHYENGHKAALVKAVMRFGKSKVVLDFVNETDFERVLILVPSRALLENWENEIKKWLKRDVFIATETLQSAHKLQGNWDLIILDEIHNLTSLKFSILEDFFREARFLIGITATLPRDYDKLAILQHLGFKLVYDLTIEDAIDKQIVNQFNVKVIASPLDKTKNIERRTRKGHTFYTSEELSYAYYTKLYANNPIKENALKRAYFLYGLKSKVEATKSLCAFLDKNNPGNRKLIFTKRVHIADSICRYSISSKQKSEINQLILNRFIDGSIDCISTVEMLNEGVTIPDIDYIIIESFDSNMNNLLQRIGRSLAYTGKTINVYIIVAEDTVEEKWLEKILPDVPVSYYLYRKVRFITRP